MTAPILILYSQGYRFDFENKRFTQTGGLFLKVSPKQAEVYIDNKLVKKTDFFFGNVLVENLLPREYDIRVQKTGYLSWNKKLPVREKQVTEAKSVVLFPEDVNFTILNKNIEELWFSPEGTNIFWKEKEGDSWGLKLYDTNREVKRRLLSAEDLSKEVTELVDLYFPEENNEICLQLATSSLDSSELLILEPREDPPVLKENQKYTIRNGSLFPLDFSIPEEINIFCEDEGIYYLDHRGHLYKTNSSFSYKQKLTEQPFPLKEEGDYNLYLFPQSDGGRINVLEPDNKFIFLQEGNTLYLFNQEKGEFEKLFEEVKSLKVSPDQEKAVYFSDSEIWIFFLRKQITPQLREEGEKIFLLRISEKINEVLWLDSSHLLFGTSKAIKVVEIDSRDQINTIDLTKHTDFFPRDKKISKMFWAPEEKKIYLLENQNLWVSQELSSL